MPVHDWARVQAGIFHAFHVAWIPQMQEVLNNGLLPKGYYALAEQHVGRKIADLLTLHAGYPSLDWPPSLPPADGGTLLAEAPPKVRRKQSIKADLRSRQRSLAIRHVSGHHLVAIVEIVSPANKDRSETVKEFAEKVGAMLHAGIHVLVVDLFPPGLHDPQGMHDAILQCLNSYEERYDLPADEPLTLASYVAGPCVDVYLEHLAVGGVLPDMPLFLHPERFINVPLESTYQQAYRGVPEFWRDVLERQSDKP